MHTACGEQRLAVLKSEKHRMDKNDETGKRKQVPLRLSNKLYAELASWAEEEFRSVNGQIEYLLTECVNKKRKSKNATGA
jgi:hypothetical protein